MPGGLVELRSFFMGGRTGDDVQLSESDGPPGSGPDRFSSFRFVSRSFADAGEGDTEALGGVGQKGTSTHVYKPGTAKSGRDGTHSRSAYLRFRFSYFRSSCSCSAFMPRICPRAAFATP